MSTCVRRILRSGYEQTAVAPGSLKPTPDVYIAWSALLNAGSAIGLAGTDDAPVQVGAKVQAGQVPQSAGQFAHDSEAAQTPSPHLAGHDEVLVHVHIDQAPFVHVCVPWPVGHSHICV